MIPQKQIAPGLKANINLIPGKSGAKDDLPAYYQDGIYTTRWKLTLKERIRVFLFGDLWLNVMGASHPPIRLDVEAPYRVIKANYPAWGMTEQEEDEHQAPVSSDSIPGEEDVPEFEDEEEEKKRKEDERGFFS